MIGSRIVDRHRGVYGHVDFIDERGIGGWILDLDGGVNVVEVYINGIKVAEKEASMPRQDIDGIVGRITNCGFFINWAEVRFGHELLLFDSFDFQVLHKRTKTPISGKYKVITYGG